ncbi:MAG: hypothetical protein MI920_15605 [Kiloniellales bacterium]|nr:hypothetical protein [Kiloniellales bacterium]
MSFKLPEVDLRDEHLRLIGLVISEWARLESVLDLALWAFLGTTQRHGRALTSQVSPRNRIPLLKEVASKSLRLDDYDTFVRMVDDAAHYLTERNCLAHAVWTLRDDGGSPYIGFAAITKPGAFEVEREPFKIPRMRKNAKNIRELTQKLMLFLERTTHAPPP